MKNKVFSLYCYIQTHFPINIICVKLFSWSKYFTLDGSPFCICLSNIHVSLWCQLTKDSFSSLCFQMLAILKIDLSVVQLIFFFLPTNPGILRNRISIFEYSLNCRKYGLVSTAETIVLFFFQEIYLSEMYSGLHIQNMSQLIR